jgi:uncharacterized protein YlxW (UPF0749 family)
VTPRSRHATSRRSRWQGYAARHGWRAVAVVVFVVAGGLFVTSSLDSGGLDLRASSVTDLDTVVRQQDERVGDLQARVATLTKEVDGLSAQVDDAQVDRVLAEVDALRGPASYDAVRGPAVTVSLDDAPKAVRDAAKESGAVDDEDLVVHQQDIQAVANALWLGGAEAMTLQGQRVISTTGIKCVGNTVRVNGRQYAPPYVITAVGDPTALLDALQASPYVRGYRTYVDAHDLGYEVTTSESKQLPAYDGSSELRYAQAG